MTRWDVPTCDVLPGTPRSPRHRPPPHIGDAADRPHPEPAMRPTAPRLLFVALALLAAAPPSAEAQAPAKRALTLEDYYRIKEVGSPRISPDARWVAYTVSTPIEATNGNTIATWLVRADGSGEPTRIEHAGGDVQNPVWQDDGRLRFTSGDARYSIDP